MTDEYRDLKALPLGTRFYVNNGAWHGRIAGTPDAKTVFVEEKGKTYPLTDDIQLDIDILKGDEK